MIHFLGTSYAVVTLKEAARRRGLKLTDNINEANLIFVSQDTPTDAEGHRDLGSIVDLLDQCPINIPVVLTSQVTPGFTRSYAVSKGRYLIYHQAETLRIEDGIQRAMYPEMFIVGGGPLVREYLDYLKAFDCPILEMSLEDAEFCKIAINQTLISQVENANFLSSMAAKCGADWGKVSQALRYDSRIGKYSYLTPGEWKNSKHLLRDYVTLQEMSK